MLNIFIDFQPEDLGRPTTGTTGNWYTRGSGRVENLTYGYGLGRVTISQLRVGSGSKNCLPADP